MIEAQSMDTLRFSGKNILIADDEEYVRSHLAKRLTLLGLNVLQAGTGNEVLELSDSSLDLIIMDVKMPVLDGLDTARRLKSNPKTSGIPVVLLSAMAQQEEVERGLATGASEYVVKPVTFNRILESINTNLL